MRLNAYRTASGHLLLHQPDHSLTVLIWPADGSSVLFDGLSLEALAPLLVDDPDAAAATAEQVRHEGAHYRVWRRLSRLIDFLYDEDHHDEAFVVRSRADAEALPLHAMLDNGIEHARLCARDEDCDGKSHRWIPLTTLEVTCIWHVNLISGTVVPPDPIEVCW